MVVSNGPLDLRVPVPRSYAAVAQSTSSRASSPGLRSYAAVARSPFSRATSHSPVKRPEPKHRKIASDARSTMSETSSVTDLDASQTPRDSQSPPEDIQEAKSHIKNLCEHIRQLEKELHTSRVENCEMIRDYAVLSINRLHRWNNMIEHLARCGIPGAHFNADYGIPAAEQALSDAKERLEKLKTAAHSVFDEVSVVGS